MKYFILSVLLAFYVLYAYDRATNANAKKLSLQQFIGYEKLCHYIKDDTKPNSQVIFHGIKEDTDVICQILDKKNGTYISLNKTELKTILDYYNFKTK